MREAPKARSRNETVQQQQAASKAARLKKNIDANGEVARKEYQGETWISDTAKFQAVNKWTKSLVIPNGVKVAESRIPLDSTQKGILKKELRQAGILSKLGNSVYLTPEPGKYKERVPDALVNGVHFEFRNITGKDRQVEQDFSDAKTKDKDANVFINIESDVSKTEARRRIGMVLSRHPDYTGRIIVSWKGGKPYFWDTSSFR